MVIRMEPDNSRLSSAKEPAVAITIFGGLDGGDRDRRYGSKAWEKLAVVVGNALGAKGASLYAPTRSDARAKKWAPTSTTGLAISRKASSAAAIAGGEALIDQQDLSAAWPRLRADCEEGR